MTDNTFDDSVEEEIEWLPAVLAKKALWTWFGFFIGALILCFGANAVFGIPFPEVVDVLIAAQLTYIGVLIFILVCLFIYMLSPPRIWSAAGAILFLMFVYALMPFAGLAAYWVYAYVGHLQLSGHSFMYDGFLANFRSDTHSIIAFVSRLSSTRWLWLESISIQIWQPIAASLGSALISAIIGYIIPEHVFVTNESGERTRRLQHR